LLNIDLLPDTSIRVLLSRSSTTVTRVGEIILLDEVPFSPRLPWEDLIVANDWHISSGIYTKEPSLGQLHGDVVRLTTAKYDSDQLSSLTDQEFLLALIQQNKENGLQAAICTGCNLVGARSDSKGMDIGFRINKCEINYNR
jgi:hypothetical protein